MSTSPTQTTSSTEAPEPLRSLLAQIDAARALPELEPYDPADGDPLDRLRRTMRGEVDAPERPEPATNAPSPVAEGQRAQSRSGAARSPAGGSPAGGSPAGGRQAAEALVGRVVLDTLRTRPLAGGPRAEAVERLATQLDQPDPDELREILALLVTGQAG